MNKPIAVFDIDGTIFRSSLLIETMNALVEKGVFPYSVTTEYMPQLHAWRNRRSITAYTEYLERLIAAYLKHIKGVSARQMEIISEVVVSQTSGHTYVYTRDLVKQIKKTHFLVAISGSPSELVSLFTKKYGFNDYHATEYEIEDGIYTGRAREGHLNKDEILEMMLKKHDLTLKGSIGVGDTKSDIKFLKLVENPIAFNPDSELLKAAREAGWKIVVERKDWAYELERDSNGTYRLT